MVGVFQGGSPVDDFGAMPRLADSVRIYGNSIGIPTLDLIFSSQKMDDSFNHSV
jgi:hypothetical protein